MKRHSKGWVMKFQVSQVFRVFSLSCSALYSPLSGLISPQTDVWVLSPPPLLQSTSSRLSGNKNNAAKQLYLCHKLSTVTNKSSSSVNILVRAQVLGVNREIFSVDYIYCLLSNSPPQGGGGLGLTFAGWSRGPLGKKCVRGFFEEFWHRLWQN